MREKWIDEAIEDAVKRYKENTSDTSNNIAFGVLIGMRTMASIFEDLELYIKIDRVIDKL